MRRAERRTLPFESLLAAETRLRSPRPAGPRPAASVVLASPSPYPVAMGGLSLQAVWESLEETGLVQCERVFCEAPEGPVLVPPLDLSAHDVVAVSLPYELEWLNLPRMLHEGQVPVWTAERGEESPLVIAGGASVTMNPEPLAEIIDAFVIGEAEPVIPDLARIAEGCALSGGREAALDALAALPGVYVPGRTEGLVQRLVWEGVEEGPRSSLVVSPHTVFPDRFLVETGRGCPQGCRFCLARQLYRPVRYARPEAVLAAARQGLGVTRRVGLIGAALSGYPSLEGVVTELVAEGADVSLSSLRADRLTPSLLAALRRGGQRTVTIAPEAASEGLRRAIGKPITDAQLLGALDAAAAAGLREVKLYFMTNLPSETPEEALGIADLVASYRRAFPALRLEVTVSPFVPKPWTPFEGETFPGVSRARERLEAATVRLRREAKVTSRAGSARWAAAQAALARGDRRVGRALVKAAEQGGGYAAVSGALRAEGIDLRGPLRAPESAPWRRALGEGEVCGEGGERQRPGRRGDPS